MEPINKKHPLVKLQNVVLAPHIGSSTKETRAKMAEITVKNLNLGHKWKKADLLGWILIFTHELQTKQMFSFYI